MDLYWFNGWSEIKKPNVSNSLESFVSVSQSSILFKKLSFV